MALPWSYTSRLGRDVDRWRDAGFINEASRKQILGDMAARGAGFSLPGALAILGATLICFSAMTFVAANWEQMSRLSRLLVLAAGMWGSYGAAVMLFSRQLPMFGHAAVLAGTGIFGASIMLVAQMYHMEGNPPDAVLMWAAGALAAGIGFMSGPVLGLSMLLVALWSAWEMQLTTGVHWAFLAAWGAVAATFLWLRWRPGLHLSALTMAGWIIALGWKLPHGPHNWLVTSIGFAIAIAGVIATLQFSKLLDGRIGAIAPTATNYGLGLGFTGLMMLQFTNAIGWYGGYHGAGGVNLVLYAIITLSIVIATIMWAMRTDNRPALWISYAAFSFEILALYFKTLGTLMNTSLFFALAGVLVIVLASAALKLAKRNPDLIEGARP
jgi:uncharacterized membrane protein